MKRALLVLMFVFWSISSAHAFTQTFFGEDLTPDPADIATLVNANSAHISFFSYLDGVNTEDFESFTVSQLAPLIADFGVAGQATIVGGGFVYTGGLGRFPISGEKYFDTNATTTGTFTITFSSPIAAFGFYGTDFGDEEGQLTITTSGLTSTSYNVPHAIDPPDGSAVYWAIIDTDNPFISITFRNTASATDWFGFDDFSIGTVSQVRDTPVPLPSSLLFLTTGMLFLIRRKK